MKKFLYSIFIIAIFVVGFAASDDSSSNQNDSQSSSVNDNSDAGNDEFVAESDETQYTDESDDSEDPSDPRYAWLQGHWVCEKDGLKGHLIINGNKIIQYSNLNPEPDEKTFRITGDEIRASLIEGMDLVIKIDFANHRIDYSNGDGLWMHKISDSTIEDGYTNDANQRVMSRLNELDNKANKLINELITMRQSGQMDPMRLMSLSQTILGYKQEQISIAERLGDNNLIYEYQQQYSDVAETLRMMEGGY